jgi:tetratricopeptide (TPR) repeat protein
MSGGQPSPAEPVPAASLDLESEIDAGFAELQAGRLAEAAKIYRGVLDKNPDHSVALHLLALLLNQRGEQDRAVDLLHRSVAADAENAAAFYDLGNILRDRGSSDEAERALRRAVELWPDWPEAQYNYGLLLESRRKPTEAAAAYRAAVAAKPDYAKALFCLATLLRKQKDSAATSAYDALFALSPDSAEGYWLRGRALSDLDQYEAALAAFASAIALEADFADAYIDQGNTLHLQRRNEAALESYERALALMPDSPVAHMNRAGALVSLQRQPEALQSYERALALDQGSADLHYNHATLLADLRRYDDAIAGYGRALALEPDHAVANCGLGICLLQRGDFAGSWERLEWRWKAKDFEKYNPLDHATPRWLGKQPLAGKSILLRGEQGLGDSLQFCRYVKKVAALGATVALEVQPPLTRLFGNLEGVSVVLPRGAPLPQCDYHTPLMSLPLAFATDLSSIPCEVPYLQADAADVSRWRPRVRDADAINVGLVWAGDSREHQADSNRVDKLRSVSLAHYAPLADVDGVRFFSLQKGGAAAQAKTPPARMQLIDYTDEFNDFADTAALVANLDLVITVDTSVAHLAGGLGIPTWMLSRYNGCWRWLLDRDDSPWYPSMRIFRQAQRGDWHEVVGRVAAALAERVKSAR